MCSHQNSRLNTRFLGFFFLNLFFSFCKIRFIFHTLEAKCFRCSITCMPSAVRDSVFSKLSRRRSEIKCAQTETRAPKLFCISVKNHFRSRAFTVIVRKFFFLFFFFFQSQSFSLSLTVKTCILITAQNRHAFSSQEIITQIHVAGQRAHFAVNGSWCCVLYSREHG